MRHSSASAVPIPLGALVVALVVVAAVALAAAVAARPACAAVVTVRVTPVAFSPNGDGVKDKVTARVRLARRARLRVDVVDRRGRLVATLQGWRTRRRGTRTFTWSGLRGGEQRANGRYVIKARAMVQRRTYKASRALTLDTLAPRVTLEVAGDATLFAGAGAQQPFHYAVEGPTPSRVALNVFAVEADDSQGAQVASVSATPPRASGEVAWDGCLAGGEVAPTARYLAQAEVIDAAGNTASSRPLPFGLFAPADVTGTVRTAGGAPVTGAQVTVQGTDLSATTGADGSFAIVGCPMGFRVFVATKAGEPDGSTRVEVNLDTAAADIALGTTATPSRALRAGHDVTMSGTLSYRDDDGVDHPMRNVRVVIEDRVRVLIGPDWYRDFGTVSTDQNGFFTYTYDYDDRWDEWDEPDVRVLVYAQDGDDDICAVYDGYWSSSPYQWSATGDYTDNALSRSVLRTNTDSEPVCRFIVDSL